MKRNLIILAAVVLVAYVAFAQGPPGQQVTGPEVHPDYGVPPNAPNQKPAFAGQTDAPEREDQRRVRRRDGRRRARSPWGLAFLPDGTHARHRESPGGCASSAPDGKLSEPVAGLPAVDARGQGGLLDVALDPDFATNRLIYWSFSEPRADERQQHRASRAASSSTARRRASTTCRSSIHQAPSLNSPLHFGSRLVWNRDGTLFVTQGDRSITDGRMQAQKMDSLLGKIVRINADGSIPKDNPFVGKDGVRPEIWSFGHRNVQAAALHPTTGELWEVEHGTRGGDEVNIAAQGQGLRLADHRLRHRVPGRADHRRHPAAGGDGAAGLLLGSEHRAERHDVLHRQRSSRRGRATCSSAASPARASCASPSTATRSSARSGCCSDMQPRERIRDVVQGPDGALYVVTDGPKGRILQDHAEEINGVGGHFSRTSRTELRQNCPP